MKNFLIIALSIICFSNSTLVMSQDQSVNISVASPKVKATENKENIRALIKSEIEKSISAIPNYVTLVERDYLDQINYRRKKLKRSDNPNIAASAMIGANYLLESKVSDIVFSDGKKVVEKAIKSRRENRYVYWNKVKYTIDFELVDIETGEIASQYRINSDGLGFESLERKSPNHTALIGKALTESRQCLSTVIQYMLLSTSLVKSRVLDVNEAKKEKAKKILIEGGYDSPFRGGLKFDIVKIYIQEMGGESLTRQEKIGEAKFKEKFKSLSMCSVSKGEKEVLKAFNDGEALYCVPKDLKYMESCSFFLGIKSKKGNAASFKSALENSPKPSESKKETKSKSTKSTKSTKKVTRKKD